MARGFGKLSAKKVEHLSKRGMHADGGGLYLQVPEGGSKSWLFRYKLHGRARWHGLGSLRDVSLEEAREKATDARKLRRNGGDPIQTKREAEAAARIEAASQPVQTFPIVYNLRLTEAEFRAVRALEFVSRLVVLPIFRTK